MNTKTLKTRLIEKINTMTEEQLTSILSFVETLENPLEDWEKMQAPKIAEEERVLVERFKKLCEETQALFADHPITRIYISTFIFIP